MKKAAENAAILRRTRKINRRVISNYKRRNHRESVS
jgi:hypothetical protein